MNPYEKDDPPKGEMSEMKAVLARLAAAEARIRALEARQSALEAIRPVGPRKPWGPIQSNEFPIVRKLEK